MASHKSPLRDRLLSNSPDPMKNSILRESGMGWNSPPTGSMSSLGSSTSGGSITSPLKISKRDSPGRTRGADVPRRTSSSFKHVRNNNLVSKSPFKSQIPPPSTPSRNNTFAFPTPPTRRVSGEKRPRPASLHDLAEAENERPFALKRERKQSKTFQGLIEKEPVTKSPFRLQQGASQENVLSSAPPPPPPPFKRNHIPSASLPIPVPSQAPTWTSSGLSPVRSSLVSRRMHGPRLSGSGRRERRKTVSFNERCDVVEFEIEEESVIDTDDEYGGSDEEREPEDEHKHIEEEEIDGGELFFQGPPRRPSQKLAPPKLEEMLGDDESYESIQLSDVGVEPTTSSVLTLDPDTSITGLVDEIFFSSHNGADVSADSIVNTPPRQSDIPTDLETEDGVPFGRSHHAERFLQHHQLQQQSPHHTPPPHFSPHQSPQLTTYSPKQHYSPQQRQSSPAYPYNFNLPTHASPSGPPATPPRRQSGSAMSTPPLGRSTHAERIKQAREEAKEVVESESLDLLPGSPSPMKKPISSARSSLNGEEGLVPRLNYSNDLPTSDENFHSSEKLLEFSDDHQATQHDIPQESAHITEDETMDRSNLSIGNSEVSLRSLGRGDELSEMSYNMDVDEAPKESSFESLEDLQPFETSPSPSPPKRAQSPIAPRVASPIIRPLSRASPASSRQASPTIGGGRPRISKEDVKRRLLKGRSLTSPSPEFGSPPSEHRPETPTDNQHDGHNILIRVERDEDGSQRDSSFSLHNDEEQERDAISVMTAQTDFSTETAIIERAEKKTLGLEQLDKSGSEFGLLNVGTGLKFDFGSKFGMGGLGFGSTESRDSLGLLKPGHETDTASVASGGSRKSEIKMGDVDVDMEMKSALDRLMDDVAGTRADDSMTTEEDDDSYDQLPNPSPPSANVRPKVMERATTDSAIICSGDIGLASRTVSGSSDTSLAPAVPPKDNIKNREQMILEKRREARRMEEDAADEFYSSNPVIGRGKKPQQMLGVGRPSRRRSMSTGDAEDIGGGAKKRGNVMLDVADTANKDDQLADSIEKELKKLVQEPHKSRYQVRERQGTIYASSSDDKISHMAGPGDVDAGRAWRTVRRPSDMNEYSKQIKEYRAQEKAKAYGKVFVKVLGIKGIHLPLPAEPTVMTCTLNNGIHFVTTPEFQLAPDCRIEQEFELIEHSKLEFTLTMKVRRDPHIIAQYKANTVVVPRPVPPAPPVVQPSTSHKSGMLSFFSSSPKKSKEKIATPPPPRPPPPQVPQPLPENLARYLKPDATLARAFISFKDIAPRCDTRLFETSYPLIGQRTEAGGKFSTLQVGEIMLQLFRLPPLPGIPADQLPQSLEECHRGLRHINWHKVTYFQGVLTQNGGDCSTWRRRQLRVIGSNLVAFNDVTKKATATIDIKKAIAVEDDQEVRNSAASRASRDDEYDMLYGVERSFRLIFPQNQHIIFFADTDEEKARWLEVLRALVGHIPPHPLWGELLWQRQEEITKKAQAQAQAMGMSISTAGPWS